MISDRAKRASRRPSRADVLSSAAAFGGTVVFALLLWFGFRAKPPVPVAPALAEARGSSHFVATPGFGVQLADWERTLHIWARLSDPTLLVLPDEELGFSQVRRTPRHLPETPIPAYRFAVTLSEEGGQSAIRLAAPRRELPDEFRRRWTIAPPETVEFPPVVPLPSTVVWHDPDGKVIDPSPELDLAAVARAFAEEGRPRHATRIEIQAGDSASPTRIRVRRSSGNPTLDRLVLAVLHREMGASERRERLGWEGNRPVYLPPPGRRTVVEIEWSLLPVELGVPE